MSQSAQSTTAYECSAAAIAADLGLPLSIKAREVEEEKEAVEQYGSSDSGASLGDILGAALREKAGDKN